MKNLKKGFTILVSSVFAFTYSLTAQLAGTYEIGSNGDYNTLEGAVNDLNLMGISGPVKFILKDAEFNERVAINNFPGESATDTVLFTSNSNDPSTVKVKIEPTDSLNNYLIKLNGCERVTIENISFETNHNIYSTHILLTNGASYNRIVGCDFVAPVGVTGLANKGTIINNIHDGEKEEYNQIIGNKIQGGNLGILVSGNLTKRELGNEVIDNKFVGQRQAAFSCIYQEVGKFNGNSVNYEQSESAVVFSKADSSFEIIGNRIYSTGNHGLHVGYHDNLQSKDTLFIANNMISARNGVALLLENSNGVVIVHNTLFSENDQAYTLTADQIDNILAENNLIINNANKGMIQVTNKGSNVESNYNGFYNIGGGFGLTDGGAIANFADWQTSSNSPGASSVFRGMSFRDFYGDLSIACGMSDSFIIDNYYSKFSKDINGNERDPSGFWMGAGEFRLPDYHTMDISGFVTNGTDTLKHAMIEVYADTSDRTLLDMVYSASIDPDGSYDFTGIPYSSEYWLKIIPNTSLAPNYITAYHGSDLRWDEGTPYVATDSCAAYVQDVFPRIMQTIPNGDFSISGTITEVGGTNKVEGNEPIPGLDVVLDKIPPVKNTVATTVTDVNGQYWFGNLPEGTYVVSIDYEGLPADTIYQVTLDSESDTVVNLDYCVDTLSSIEGCSPELNSVSETKVRGLEIYPNPMTDFVTIKAESTFSVLLFDINGRVVKSIYTQENVVQVSTVELPKGVYFINVDDGKATQTIKVLK